MKTRLRTLGFFVLLFTATAAACGEQRALNDASKMLPTSSVVMSYSQEDGRNVITTLGLIKNTSGAMAESLVVEVRYLDRHGVLIDTATQPLYGIAVPAGQEISFRVRAAADKPKAAYASTVARVVSADQRIDVSPQEKRPLSRLTELLFSWAPMLLFVGVLIYLIRKGNRKDSPQRRHIDLMERQNATLVRQLEVFERLAAAVEKAASK